MTTDEENVTTPIQFLTPEAKATPAEGTDGTGSNTGTTGGTSTTTTVTVDATFKNQQPEEPEKYEAFTATKIWDDNDDASKFRPSTTDFKKLLTLTRTASKQGVTGGAAAMTETLKLDTDYTIKIEPEGGENNTWTITITPVGGQRRLRKVRPQRHAVDLHAERTGRGWPAANHREWRH